MVLGLLAAMLALALPIALRSVERSSFRAAVGSVVASLDEARSHAQREGVMVEVIVDADGRRLRALERPEDGGPPTPISTIDLGLEVPIEFDGDAGKGLLAIFLPDGSAPISRPGILRSDDGTQVTISIGPHLGRATVVERLIEIGSEDEEPTPPPDAAPRRDAAPAPRPSPPVQNPGADLS